jgi:hypothetical protein
VNHTLRCVSFANFGRLDPDVIAFADYLSKRADLQFLEVDYYQRFRSLDTVALEEAVLLGNSQLEQIYMPGR